MTPITGHTLMSWGFKPSKWFTNGLMKANLMRGQGKSDEEIFAALQTLVPIEVEFRTNAIPFATYLDPQSDVERENLAKVTEAMDALMRTPTIKFGAVMPDACPAGTIPVGGIVATENAIHPGFHSADICCSMGMTIFKRNDDPKALLDVAHRLTHFGPGKRSRSQVRQNKDLLQILELFDANPFLKGLEVQAQDHFMTQGDGNHFLSVGHLQSSGQLALVTHHGSRSLGAMLYKRGMAAAKRHTKIMAPRVPEANAWLDFERDEGRDYWDALQIVGKWTELNHRAIHDAIARTMGNSAECFIWNAHNFVFRKPDGLFYHAKGATPSWQDIQMIPMNMARPILITRQNKHRPADALGFAPHGAGRNFSRTAHMKSLGHRDRDEIFREETKGIDARFFSGIHDLSELPSAYKDTQAVEAQIVKYQLTDIMDRVLPYGSIMAGNQPQHWKN